MTWRSFVYTLHILHSMIAIEKNDILQLEILRHVEENPRLNNRIAAEKLGCSVKLAHALLKKMAARGLLHIDVRHARQWDYFLTPTGIAEKARLTYEFIGFSMQFYHEARKASSALCRRLADEGARNVSFAGSGELAEIAYLGVKEWNLNLEDAFDGWEGFFLGKPIRHWTELPACRSDAVVMCLYDKAYPMTRRFVPPGVPIHNRLRWIFDASAV